MIQMSNKPLRYQIALPRSQCPLHDLLPNDRHDRPNDRHGRLHMRRQPQKLRGQLLLFETFSPVPIFIQKKTKLKILKIQISRVF